MATPKIPAGTYSARLRARREQRPRPVRRGAIVIGEWTLADEGDLVIVNQRTGARIVLAIGEPDGEEES